MNSARIVKLMDELSAELRDAAKDRDEFALFFFQSRREIRQLGLADGKHARSQKTTVQLTFLRAREYGFQGSREQWEHLLYVGR